MKYLFKNGTVVSGRGTRRADVLVEDEIILQYGARATVPMGEFWVETDDWPDAARTAWGWWCINGMCAPVAHVHGRRIVAAEAFSAAAWHGRWKKGPFEWKATGDRAFCDGDGGRGFQAA